MSSLSVIESLVSLAQHQGELSDKSSMTKKMVDGKTKQNLGLHGSGLSLALT